MVLAIYSKSKLGQADLIYISMEDLQYGCTQRVFLPRWVVFPNLISDTAHLNEDDHGSCGPYYRFLHKNLSPCIHAVTCLTLLIAIGH